MIFLTGGTPQISFNKGGAMAKHKVKSSAFGQVRVLLLIDPLLVNRSGLRFRLRDCLGLRVGIGTTLLEDGR